MRIAMIGPISMELLDPVIRAEIKTPKSHSFGLSADLVNGLLARGHEVDVYTLSPGSVGLFHAKFPSMNIWAAPTRGRLSALKLYSSERHVLAELLRAAGPYSVVHGHWLYEYALVALNARSPALITIHDWPAYIFRSDPSFVRFVKLMMSRVVVPRVTHASAPSQYMADVAKNNLGIEMVEVIANALPSTLLLGDGHAKCQPPSPVLLAINHGFSPRKNVSTLIEAMVLVRRAVPNATLRLIGSGYGPGESASSFAARRGMSEGIVFLGRLERTAVLDELTAATVFIHPSKEESFGLVLTEAMARQTPVIAGRTAGAVPWILEGGISGALCDTESREDLAKTIIDVITSPHRRRYYVENGLRRVKSSFLMDNMVTSFEQLYARIESRSQGC